MERKAKGIWIPIEVWEDKNLSWNEKILFLEIDSYTSKDSDCYISNEYISKLLGVTETSANKILASLISKGYVVKTKFDGRKRYIKTNMVYRKSVLPYEESQPCRLEQPCIAAESNILIQSINTDINTDKEEKEDKSSSKKKNTFQFRQSIIDLGVKPEIVDDWLIVRKNKRASNTETAFKRIKSEIAKSGRSANDCITFAVERSWQGFMAEWMLNEINKGNNQKPKPKTQEEINREKLTMPILNEEGDLPDGTFFKNGKRWYFSKQEGRAASCAPDASPRPNDRAEYDWTIKDWRVPRDKWEASDEIW